MIAAPKVCTHRRSFTPSRPPRTRAWAHFVLTAVVLAISGSHEAQAQTSTKTIDRLTSELSAGADDANRDNPTQLAQLLDVARARRAQLAKLIEADPAAALRSALPKERRDKLPSSVQALVERDSDLVGTLELTYEDGPQKSVLHHALKVGGQRLALHFAGAPKGLVSGSRVRVKGLQVNNMLALGESDSLETLELSSTNTFGEQKTLVMLVNFQDSPLQPYTADTARDVIFNQANTYLRESSSQQTWLAGDVVGWYTLPVSVATCDGTLILDNGWRAAQAAGVDVFSYERWIFAFPANACGWWGKGTIGGGTSPGNPSFAFINGTLARQVVVHELGHNLGLYHAHAIACADGTSGIVPNSSCYTYDYGDTVDNMGNATGYWNAFNKEQLGWMNYGTSPAITTVQSPGGSFWIGPYEAANANAKALKIMRPNGSALYVELRQPVGADSFISAQTSHGVFIRTATPGMGNTSLLYDMTPSTLYEFTDGSLGVGQTFSDPSSNISITTLSADASGANVSVSFGSAPQPCSFVTPLISLSPSSASIAAGLGMGLTVSVTNRNSSVCAASTFTVSGTGPAGWGATVSSPTTLNLAPGATGSTTLQVAVPASATAGSYSVLASAVDSASAANTASASASITVPGASSCAALAPLVALSPAQATLSAGGNTSLSVSVTNRNSSACAPATFSLGTTLPAGWTGTLANTTLTVNSGAASSTNVQVTSPASATAGAYQLTVSASANGNSGSGSASLTIEAPSGGTCTMTPLTISLSPSQASVTPGGGTSLTLTLTNRNSAACGASTFNLMPAAAAGLSATLGSTSVTVNAQSTGSTTVQVNAVASTAVGSYPVTVFGYQTTNSGNSGAGSAMIAVQSSQTPSCTRTAPTLTLSSSPSSLTPGGLANLSVSLTNRNSSACGTSTFTLLPNLPSGWTPTPASSSLSVAAGSSASMSMVVAPSATAANGSYTVGITASENGNSGNAGSGSTTIAVQAVASCVAAAPTVTLSPAQSSMGAGGSKSLTVSVTNRDSATCASSSFTVTPSVPSGWTANLPASVTVGPGVTGSTTLQVTAPATTPSGSYTVTVTSGASSGASTQNLGPGLSGSASATIAVAANTLTVGLSSDKASYRRGQTAQLTAVVTQGGTPAASAIVTFTIVAADGGTTTQVKTADGNGRARFNFKIDNRAVPGPYSVTATGTKNELSGTGTTSFTVTQ